MHFGVHIFSYFYCKYQINVLISQSKKERKKWYTDLNLLAMKLLTSPVK